MSMERNADCRSLIEEALALKAAGGLSQGLAAIRQAQRQAGNFSKFFLDLIQVLLDQDQADRALALTQQVLEELDQDQALLLYESAMSLLAQTAPSTLKEFSELGLFVRQGPAIDQDWIDFIFYPDQTAAKEAAASQKALTAYLDSDLGSDPSQAMACYQVLDSLAADQVQAFIRAYLTRHPGPSLVRTDFLVRLLEAGDQGHLVLEGPFGKRHELHLATLDQPQDRSFFQAGQDYLEACFFKEPLVKAYLEEEWVLLTGLLYPFEGDLDQSPADLLTALAAADPEDDLYRLLKKIMKGVI
ncbi:hypothetical protein ACWOE5_01345 [Aerococcus sanguinicola]|uniref:Tetratricopeptide repeat protein n=1 Tax=Aerococcus sanguinicola TaxID=119206 RepID=A0A0X8FCN3_9LACT|nr:MULTISPECIES: hypothetical protein [Aerococcus]AMB94862.1 hypothetical protein AWM72_08870 [Aerococcus sanguinicola]MDK7049637.1 hypothetical protein [Aerococcus sanguinicola]OFT95847.1 hypothetical protein HMPREF3090_03205 [Aerococcus sp. HMSC23C02]PKZ23133.1 hypothetical protein CYJ28_00880 [Aerococcus sanguinicola]